MKCNEQTLEPLDDIHTAADVLVDLCRSLVDHEMKVVTTETDSVILIELNTKPDTKDAAKLVGSSGYVIKMLKQMASLLTARYEKRVQLELDA